MADFSSMGIDPIKGAEIVDMIGIEPHELDHPPTLRKITEIAQFFQDKPNRKSMIAKVLFGRRGESLDNIHRFVVLEKAKLEELAKIPQEMMTEDIIKEINSGYLTDESIDKIQRDLDNEVAEMDEVNREKAGVVKEAVNNIKNIKQKINKVTISV